MEFQYRNISRAEAESVLQKLVGCPLCYGIKSSDMDLYDFGFGDCEVVKGWCNKERFLAAFTIHAVCCIEIIGSKDNTTSVLYDADTPCEQFHGDIAALLGLTVKRIALSKKNDLWIDLGKYSIVLITYEDKEESWRFFADNDLLSDVITSYMSIEIPCEPTE